MSDIKIAIYRYLHLLEHNNLDNFKIARYSHGSQVFDHLCGFFGSICNIEPSSSGSSSGTWRGQAEILFSEAH